MVDYDDTVMSYATGERPHRLRADPQPRDRYYDFISVDDHLVEPPTTFTGRLPKRFADVPRASSAVMGSTTGSSKIVRHRC